MAALVWFRRDLRLADHPALAAALRRHRQVVPVFCLDDQLLRGRHASPGRNAFLLDCLADLDLQLAERGSRLIVRHGPPEAELPQLALAVGAAEVHVTADLSPYARRRDHAVGQMLARVGVTLVGHPGLSTVEDVVGIRTTQGRPYTVFTPFYRRWAQAPRRAPLAAPARVPGPEQWPASLIPSPASLAAGRGAGADPGGEREATARLERFLAGPVLGYAAGRGRLEPAGSSRLSCYLRFGCLSARSVEASLPPGEGAEEFRRQLCWRDFFQHVLAHHPSSGRQEFQARYRGALAWIDDRRGLAAWQRGETGFPLVDAGMRQLREEGWMPGRARLVAGSFLTKDLGIDWRSGEEWFMRWLVDGDMAANTGNWQWVASVGVDPAPPFRRLYNPAAHQRRYDADGAYVRRWAPELARVPAQFLGEPHRMSEAEQRRAGCRIGRDYPAPIVDHRVARAAALARYRACAVHGLRGQIASSPPGPFGGHDVS